MMCWRLLSSDNLNLIVYFRTSAELNARDDFRVESELLERSFEHLE